MSEELVPMTIGWFDMPLEMREIVIGKMTGKSKVRFAECSKVCEEEVLDSKSFINRIKLEINLSQASLTIHIQEVCFVMEFVKISENLCEISYLGFSPEKKWEEKGDFEQVVLEHFEVYKNKAKHLEKLSISGTECPYFDQSLVNFRRLKRLDIKLRRGPSRFSTRRKKNRRVSNINGSDFLKIGLIDYEQIAGIEGFVRVQGSRLSSLTMEQICQLRASRISLSQIKCRSNDFNEYIRKWLNCEIHPNTKEVKLISTTCYRSKRVMRNIPYLVDRYDREGESWYELVDIEGKPFGVFLKQSCILIKYIKNEFRYEYFNSDDSEDDARDIERGYHSEYEQDPLNYSTGPETTTDEDD